MQAAGVPRRIGMSRDVFAIETEKFKEESGLVADKNKS